MWAADITYTRCDVFDAETYNAALKEADKRREEAGDDGEKYIGQYVWPAAASYPAPYA